MPRHELDALSLMAGVAFAGLAVVVLVTEGSGVTGRWTWPLLLIVVGLVGLVANHQAERRHDAPAPRRRGRLRVRTSRGRRIMTLHVWLAPVRNLRWVAASFGYR